VKALDHILLTESGIITSIKLFSEKVEFQISVIEFGIVTVVKFLLLKALSQIISTPADQIEEGITTSLEQEGLLLSLSS